MYQVKPFTCIVMIAFAVAFAGWPSDRVSAGPAEASAGFAGVFGDHMVLQRGAPIRVWGHTIAGGRVEVDLAGEQREAQADDAGTWRVEFPVLPAGGPHEMELLVDGEERVTLTDVMIGDVWLCSGQSNMAWPVSLSSSAGLVVAPNPHVRLLTIERDSAVRPRKRFAERPQWRIAGGDASREFSAVCLFFALHLDNPDGAPLGLIHSSWGGSQIEAWISQEGLGHTGGFEEPLGWLDAYASDVDEGVREFGSAWESWWHDTGAPEDPWSAEFDPTPWSQAPEVMTSWKQYGDPGLQQHDGMVWFRNTFDLEPEQAQHGATLDLGGIDEVDVTWVNGRLVGSSFGWGTERSYQVPAQVLRAGRNSVTLNVLSTWAAGGMTGPADQVRLRLADGSEVPLGTGWRYRAVPVEYGTPPRAPWESIGGLAGLYNAMIAPLGGLSLSGALWYQGESNTGRAYQYDELLAELIHDWRRTFGDALPFIVVQLPNFGGRPTEPGPSGWAALRDAQQEVAVRESRTGLVVTVDAGDDFDLHPPNKLIVGQRAADVAGVLIDRNPGLEDGVVPANATRTGSEIIVDFEPRDLELVVTGDRTPVAFELCSASGKCDYANARLEGGRIHLSGPGVGEAARVRHCWADAPVCNLFSESGLPVSSFEIAVESGEEVKR